MRLRGVIKNAASLITSDRVSSDAAEARPMQRIPPFGNERNESVVCERMERKKERKKSGIQFSFDLLKMWAVFYISGTFQSCVYKSANNLALIITPAPTDERRDSCEQQ